MAPRKSKTPPARAGRSDAAAQSEHGSNGSPSAATAQRARVLAPLRAGRPLTTLQARRELDTLHPAARVMELRRAGWSITTTWVREESDAGQPHSVALYKLLSEPRQGALPLSETRQVQC